MVNAGMWTGQVARHVGCSSRAIRNLSIGFRTTGSTNDLRRCGRPRVTTRGQDSYILNTHLCNLFQTDSATAANTPVPNRLRENGLHARRPYGPVTLLRMRGKQELRVNCSLIRWYTLTYARGKLGIGLYTLHARWHTLVYAVIRWHMKTILIIFIRNSYVSLIRNSVSGLLRGIRFNATSSSKSS